MPARLVARPLGDNVQVGLSGYMAGAAIYYARSAGYGLICNEFNPAEANITYVQWLFYVSKVRISG